jgi:uncharacterized membrane protein
MLRPAIAYLTTGVVFLAMDATWLTLAGPALYKPEIGALLADKVAVAPAVLFYAIYIGGLVYFAVLPGLKAGSLAKAALAAAILGVVAYGAYDLTNAATLKSWSVKVTVADLCWGAFASAVAACAGAFATRKLG